MLIDLEPEDMIQDPILRVIALANGNFSGVKKIQTGLYEIGHFGGSLFLRDWEQWPDLGEINCYGVCDTPQQVVDKFPVLKDSDRGFVVTVTKVEKSKQSDWGGWRWHKWGPYIGNQTPTMEYLYDEPEIEEVWVYHIYEKV